MLGWLRNLIVAPAQPVAESVAAVPETRTRVVVRAAYDNAQTNEGNKKLWALADLLSAKSANLLPVRQNLRKRSRYEIANSSYLTGILHTSVNDLIGTGPTLQVLTKSKSVNKQVEAGFSQWAEVVAFTEKLRTAALAKKGDGEGILIITTKSGLDSPVKLFLRDVETDMITTPILGFNMKQWVDGVILDEMGDAQAYHLLRQHPGDLFFNMFNPLAFDTIAARYVLMWFRKDRPGQVRGIPETTPSLELFGEMRRYRRAVLGAAETAASFAAFLKTKAPANEEDDADGGGAEPFKSLEIVRNMMTQLPDGTEIDQLKAEQPTTTFEAFTEKLLAEACRCLSVPLNVALGSSQKFNFSSSRLDFTNYYAGLRIERYQCEHTILNRVFRAWLDEAIMIPGLLPDSLDIENLPFDWHWPGFPYLDPMTDAQADTERLTANRTKTYKQHFAEQGKDWEDEFAQFAEEAALAEKLGLPPVGPTKTTITEQADPNGDPAEEVKPRKSKPSNVPTKKQSATAA